MAELIYTGKQFVNLDNVTNIEIKQPGEIKNYEYKYAGEYLTGYPHANESTVLEVLRIGDGGEYGYSLRLTDGEAEQFLTTIGFPQLFEVKESVNDEVRAEYEKADAEWKAECERRGVDPAEAQDIPF